MPPLKRQLLQAMMPFAQTVTAESCDASAQTATAEGCDASAQTATAERCDASTQTATAESCHALTQTDDIPDDVTKNAQVELTRQLTDAQSKIGMLEKARADVMSFARGTINSAKEEQREMMDHIKKDYDEKIAQRGNEISLGPVRIGTIEKNGSRGIRFINTSQCSKSITVVYPGNPKPYRIALNPKKERVFGVTSKFQDAKEAHLSSEVGERKTLPLVERCIFPLHISTNDDLYHLLADALVDEARTGSTDAGKYLEATLNTDRYGYPNIAITAEGLRWNQVVNNIVEAVYSIMSKALHGESFDVGMFVREAILERFIEQPAGVAVGAPCGDSVSNGENKFGSPVQQNPLGGDSYDVNDTIIVSDMDRPEGGQVGDTPSCIACLACLAEA
ncbi:hypothetical protein FOZ60_001520 [Perkinsus olseni]|uniref:Uncharacterized protein n=1 Tax=Perkinsus olseni TaxID=32597 RepID=A0A7J6P084_PEROL|nr:hypothetical protein FOZ60_001520 [Perkinsus olseni]